MYAHYISRILHQKAVDEGATARLFITCAQSAEMPLTDAHCLSEALAPLIGEGGNFVLASISESIAPEKIHLLRAAQLGMDTKQISAVICAEVVLARDEEARRGALRAEMASANIADLHRLAAEVKIRVTDQKRIFCGIVCTVRHLRKILLKCFLYACHVRFCVFRQMSSIQSECQLTRADALLLAEILRSSVFAKALGDARAEAHFSSAVRALHYHVRALATMLPNRATPTTRERLASTVELCPRHVEALGCLTEERLSTLAVDGSDHDYCSNGGRKFRAIIAEIYDRGREELAGRLCDDSFLSWLEANAACGGTLKDFKAKKMNPFSVETAALSEFHLAQTDTKPLPPAKAQPPLSERINSMVCKARDPGIRGDSGARALPTFVLGISERREEWDVWAGDAGGLLRRTATFFLKKRGVDEGKAFLPSILIVCVGISIAIILNSFVSQMSLALQSRNVLFSAIASMLDINFLFLNLAIGSLNLAGCTDPVQLRQMLDVSPASYTQDLANWPPLVSAVTRALSDPNVMAALTIAASQAVTSGGVGADVQAQLRESLAGALVPALAAAITNSSSPSVLATLPVYGPLLGCLIQQGESPEVQVVLNRALAAVNSQSKQQQIHVTVTNDPCRRGA